MWRHDEVPNSNLNKYLTSLSSKEVRRSMPAYVEQVHTALAQVNAKTKKPIKVNMMAMHQNSQVLSKCDWIPDECTCNNAKVLPESISEFGRPWLFGYNNNCTRASSEKSLFVGMPAYLFTWDQPIFLIAWNLKEVQKLNAKLDSTSFIEKLGKDKSVEWCCEHFKITMVRPRSCVWIPFGWRYISTGMGPKETVLIHQPVMSTPYLKSHPTDFVDVITKMQIEFCKNNAAKQPFASIISPYKTWLKTFGNNNVPEKKDDKKEKKEKTDKKEKSDKKDKKDKKSSSSKSHTAKSHVSGKTSGSKSKK